MVLSFRIAGIAAFVVTLFVAAGVSAQESRLEPIPLPQSEAIIGPTIAPSAQLPPDGTFLIEPPVIVEPTLAPLPVVPEQTAVVPPVVAMRPAPAVVVTHYLYRPRLGTLVPVSVTLESPPAPLALATPLPVVTTIAVPRHVPGQPVRNAMRRRLLIP